MQTDGDNGSWNNYSDRCTPALICVHSTYCLLVGCWLPLHRFITDGSLQPAAPAKLVEWSLPEDGRQWRLQKALWEGSYGPWYAGFYLFFYWNVFFNKSYCRTTVRSLRFSCSPTSVYIVGFLPLIVDSVLPTCTSADWTFFSSHCKTVFLPSHSSSPTTFSQENQPF